MSHLEKILREKLFKGISLRGMSKLDINSSIKIKYDRTDYKI